MTDRPAENRRSVDGDFLELAAQNLPAHLIPASLRPPSNSGEGLVLRSLPETANLTLLLARSLKL